MLDLKKVFGSSNDRKVKQMLGRVTKIIKYRGDKLAVAECNCTVDGQVASSAEMMFTIVNIDEAE